MHFFTKCPGRRQLRQWLLHFSKLILSVCDKNRNLEQSREGAFHSCMICKQHPWEWHLRCVRLLACFLGFTCRTFFVGWSLSGLCTQVEEIRQDLVVGHVRVFLAVPLPFKHGRGIQFHLKSEVMNGFEGSWPNALSAKMLHHKVM